MTGKQARVVFQALLLIVCMAAATAQGTNKSKAVAQPTPTPSSAGGSKTNLPAATMRKAGGDPGINPCFKPASSEMRKAGGEAGMIEWRKPTNTPANGKTNAAVTDGASHKTGLKVYSKSAKHNTRKAGGDAGIDPCFKPGNTKPASSEMRKAGGQPDKAGGDTAVTIAIQPSSLNGDGKTANSKTRKAGGNTGIDPCWKPDAKSGRPSGKRIVQPNSSSATKSAISGSTGGAPKPDGRSLPLPQTGVPK